MKKGHLVNPIQGKTQLSLGPYIIVRGPYEFASASTIRGRKVTQLIRCVDLLDPTGSILKHVSCEILERV